VGLGGAGVAVAVAVVAGLAHAAGFGGAMAGLGLMQLHVGAALVAVPLLGCHALARPARARRTDLDRRAVLHLGGVGAAGLAGWWVLGSVPGLLRGAGAARRQTGSLEQGSGRPEAMPVTQWLFDTPPEVDPGSWKLTLVSGGHRRVLSGSSGGRRSRGGGSLRSLCSSSQGRAMRIRVTPSPASVKGTLSRPSAPASTAACSTVSPPWEPSTNWRSREYRPGASPETETTTEWS